MSNFRAIAAVTATLLGIIDKAAAALLDNQPLVLSLPPGELAEKKDFINLFLYMARENSAGRNMDLPARDASGRRLSVYPLVLDLYFLLSAYSNTGLRSDELFGLAVQALHENPVLNRQEINDAVNLVSILKDKDVDLADQLEQVKITPKSLNNDELSKLWSAFQAPFRTSATYKVSVVVIEPDEGTSAPLPVLTLGPKVEPSLLPPLPTLTELTPPNLQTAVRVGETLTLKGAHLNGTNIKVSFRHRLLEKPIEVEFPDENEVADSFAVTLKPEKNWAAGTYGVTVTLKPPDEEVERSTNEMPLTLAPIVTVDDNKITNAGGEVTIDDVECTPVLLDNQPFSLLVGSIELHGEAKPLPDPPPASPTQNMVFKSKELQPGKYWYRLRVDGVDSLLILRSDEEEPKFDSSQQLTVGNPT